jgi:hypothetical protein
MGMNYFGNLYKINGDNLLEIIENDVKHFLKKHPDRTPTHILLNQKYIDKVDKTIKIHGVELEVVSDKMQGLADYTIAEMRDK